MRRAGYNPKRQIAPDDPLTADQREAMAAAANYGGNPEHKRTPGDYGLTPPASPRPGKTLCDGERVILMAEATDLLKAGLRKGIVSIRRCKAGKWPQNVWAVSASGDVFEAQLENAERGIYHGYPVPMDDDFRSVVDREWQSR